MDITGNHQFSSGQPVESAGSAAASLTSVPIKPASYEPEPEPVRTAVSGPALHHIGYVMEIAGSSSQVTLDAAVLNELMAHSDPSIAMAGQVGSQIKIRVGSTWLLASIRTQKLHEHEHGAILAAVDFLGEGDEGDRRDLFEIGWSGFKLAQRDQFFGRLPNDRRDPGKSFIADIDAANTHPLSYRNEMR